MTTISGLSPIITPLGKLWSVYADFTASGVPHPSIESAISRLVYPHYGNTHSNAHNGQLMQHYIDESKRLVRQSVGAKQCDRVIMTGNGCTGAIMHLIHILNLRVQTSPQTTVFISIAEHHSNHLPWKHLPVELVVVPLLDSGIIDCKFLYKEMQVRRNAGRSVICSFIAGSNVTGVVQPFYAMSSRIHRLGGLVFWDFAGCAPYVPINMHMRSGGASGAEGDSYFDAIMLSPHKMLGGVGTPGLLVANHNLFRNKEPYCPGGGTVRFVTKEFTHYSSNLEQRETGGTPNIIGCIKMGLTFQLKDRIIGKIMQREDEINALVREQVRQWTRQGIPILMLNPEDKWRTPQVPIYSFVVGDMHYNYVVVLLNDFFGIQTRGGVSCCSMYAQHLLHVSKQGQEAIYRQIVSDGGVPKDYGWCRVSFHYTMTNEMVGYILDALESVARYGGKWADHYTYDQQANRWSRKGWKGYQWPKLDYRDQGMGTDDETAKPTDRLLSEQFKKGIKELSK